MLQLLMITFVSFWISIASAQTEPILLPTSFNAIYAPNGFDSNDNVQLIGEGLFPNTCYRPAPAKVSVDSDRKLISLTPMAYQYNGMCLQVILPYERVIDIGILKAGTYTVEQLPDHSILGSVQVSPALSENPDDFLYAPISQAFFKQRGSTSEVALSGDFLSECMSLREVKVTIEPKAIVLQPIVQIEDRPRCQEGRFPFNKVVSIDNIPKGRYMLHVRSMNGKAINSLVDVK